MGRGSLCWRTVGALGGVCDMGSRGRGLGLAHPSERTDPSKAIPMKVGKYSLRDCHRDGKGGNGFPERELF